MKAYLRDKEKETAFLIFSQILGEEEEKKRQIEQDWKQRKYELSNDFGKDGAFGNLRQKLKEKNYFPKHLEYDTDRFGYPVINNSKKKDNSDIDFGIFDVDEEDHPGLLQILRTRHNLPSGKRVLA
jgi:hypothetical protein